MKKVLLFLSLSLGVVIANESYTLKYSIKDANCTLEHNGKNIELFDKRFGQKAPKSSYLCSALQKEHYKECKVIENKNISAHILAYGMNERTNLVLAFQGDNNKSDSYSRIECNNK